MKLNKIDKINTRDSLFKRSNLLNKVHVPTSIFIAIKKNLRINNKLLKTVIQNPFRKYDYKCKNIVILLNRETEYSFLCVVDVTGKLLEIYYFNDTVEIKKSKTNPILKNLDCNNFYINDVDSSVINRHQTELKNEKYKIINSGYKFLSLNGKYCRIQQIVSDKPNDYYKIVTKVYINKEKDLNNVVAISKLITEFKVKAGGE